MGEHGAHHEMQVPGRDRLTVHAREVIESGIAVAALVLPVGFLDFPIMDQRLLKQEAKRSAMSRSCVIPHRRRMRRPDSTARSAHPSRHLQRTAISGAECSVGPLGEPRTLSLPPRHSLAAKPRRPRGIWTRPK
jgi:hypothetical protein